jgi:NADPH:quinone reductase-like Zn-dependent oxidoreductase
LKVPSGYAVNTEILNADANDFSFFTYGASTSAGVYAAQLVRWSARFIGKTVKLINTVSKKRFPMLQSKPYEHDGFHGLQRKGWLEQVKELTDGRGVDIFCDCISEGSKVKKASSTPRDGGGVAIVRSK